MARFKATASGNIPFTAAEEAAADAADAAWAAGQLGRDQAAQIAAMTQAYQAAITQPVTYNAVVYQADTQSAANVQAAIAGCIESGATPAGFYWVAADNSQVPFSFANLQGLASAMFTQGAAAFARLQTRKGSIRAATTSAQVAAVIW